MFGFGKKNQNQDQFVTGVTSPNNNLLQLNKTLVLNKEQSTQALELRKEVFTLVLNKNGIGQIVARVVLVMDKSGSMRSLYNNGTVQRVIERLLPVGLRFDDNGELDMYLFSSDSNAYKRLDSVTENDFYQYVDREILNKRENNFWGGTEYAPVINEITQEYGIRNSASVPTFVIFITDGENSDKNNTKQALTNAARYPIFWQFIGIGDERFEFLKRLDDLSGRMIDNANFFQLNDIHDITDEELYDRLMNEFPSWIDEAKSKGILR